MSSDNLSFLLWIVLALLLREIFQAARRSIPRVTEDTSYGYSSISADQCDHHSGHDDSPEKSASPLFARLPLEIRIIIYHNLLVSKHDGQIPSSLVNARENAPGVITNRTRFDNRLAGYQVENFGIDPTILRVCWKSYCEALPVLYGENVFNFDNPVALKRFRMSGLPLLHPSNDERTKLPVFNTQPSPQGRLSMVRKLSLDLGNEGDMQRREWSIGAWEPFLETNPYVDGSLFICFPLLEELELDFSKWKLYPEEGLEVSDPWA